MRYRGWVMTADGKWFPLDRMQTGDVNKATGLTLTHRGVTDDGWFFLEAGGWSYRKAVAREWIELRSPSGKPAGAEYLKAADIAALTSVPSEIVATKVERTQDRARVTFRIRNLGAQASATLYWGNTEALTLAERWPHQQRLTSLREGENQCDINGIPAGQPLCVRLLLKNDEGQFWTPATVRAAAR